MTRFYRLAALAAFLFAGVVSHAGVSSPAHIARMNQYDVTFYWLDLEIQKANNNIGGNALTRAKCLVNQMDTFALELASTLTVDSVMVSIDNGDFVTTPYTHTSGELNVLLTTSVLQNQMVDVRVFYHGAPTISNLANNSGFFTGNLGKFSASPPYNSNTWWPCKQSLTDLADSSWFYVTTAAADRGIANGLLTNVVDLGENKRWEWKSKYPINFYLIAFVVTSFEEVTEYWHPVGRTDSLRLDYYGYVPEEAQDILQVFSDKFGLYPFYDEKLGFAKVNLAGGIENQTLIASNGGVDAHEIAHQWFGNYVGCASWKDVMLSEGLSTWAESVYAEFTAPDAASANAARMSYYTENSTTNSVYGAALDTANLLSVFGNPGLYYRKASMVINTLRYHINDDELFFEGIRNYLNEFGGRTAYGSDFKAVMESTTGLDLEDFFNQWYYKGGAPTFNITWNSNGTYLALRILQTTNSPENPLYKTPVDIKVEREEGDMIVRLFIDANDTEHLVWCPGTITGFKVDPNQWMTNGVGTVTHNPNMVVGVDQLEQPRYAIYPNPAKDRILITAAGQETVSVKIFDSVGALCFANDTFRLNQYLDLPALAKGSYIVQIADGQSLMVHKLLID
jgi:aminopeptidase N